VVDHTF